MIDAKEKAYFLFKKYYENLGLHSDYINKAKQCALIAVDEILNTEVSNSVKGNDYWQEVKKEIEKLV